MATFMDVHTDMKGFTADPLHQEHQKDLENQGPQGVRFLKAWGDPVSGRVFCLSEGPSKEAVLAVHAKSGHPASEIYEVPVTAE